MLACQNNDLDLCNIKNLPGVNFADADKMFPPTWRYFPTLDPQVSIFCLYQIDWCNVNNGNNI